MLRQARLDTPGTLHHVILRGIEKNNRQELVMLVNNVPYRTKIKGY